MTESIILPKLNGLRPTMHSTLFKIMEEAGELARAVLKFLPYEQLSGRKLRENATAAAVLAEVAGELLDVAQTCVTMIFVLEEDYGICADRLIDGHLHKLDIKGYVFDRKRKYRIATAGDFKYLELPRLLLDNVTLLTTVCKIQEEVGELTQFLGKKAGASGERVFLPEDAVLTESAMELLDVAQCCFTMMYILADKYDVDISELTERHIAKLRRKGYCA